MGSQEILISKSLPAEEFQLAGLLTPSQSKKPPENFFEK
jgi:hypothetical protein